VLELKQTKGEKDVCRDERWSAAELYIVVQASGLCCRAPFRLKGRARKKNARGARRMREVKGPSPDLGNECTRGGEGWFQAQSEWKRVEVFVEEGSRICRITRGFVFPLGELARPGGAERRRDGVGVTFAAVEHRTAASVPSSPMHASPRRVGRVCSTGDHQGCDLPRSDPVQRQDLVWSKRGAPSRIR
jgi:hypothetical protein